MYMPIALLIGSNIFMTYAWYGHLKSLSTKPIWIVILISWGIAFFEYCLQVPANRTGAAYFTVPQLKIIQEIVTLVVFAAFLVFYFKQPLKLDYLWAGLCMIGAAYFMFRSGLPIHGGH